jgi:hypothetical protein
MAARNSTASGEAAPVTRPEVRHLVDRVLPTDTDLDVFAGDYCNDVYRSFTKGMLRPDKVSLLLDKVPLEILVDLLDRAHPAVPAATVARAPAPSAVAGPSAASTSAPFSDPLLADLREAYLGEDLLLFAGAGVSAAAGLPSWKRLVELLFDRAQARNVAAPTLQEIADLLAREQLIDALSAVKAALGPNDFGTTVERLLDDKGHDAPAVARGIASLAPRLRGVLTTNVDHLLEKAFLGAWPALAKVTGDIVRRRHYILKIHGTLLDRASWVFTRDEYDRAMYADPKLQTAFYAVFHGSPVLFVGYGLADADFDQVLARVRVFAGEQPPRHFALIAEETITPHRKARLEGSGVQLIPYANPDGKHEEAVRILDWLAGS